MDQYNAEDTHDLVTEDEVDRTKHKVYLQGSIDATHGFDARTDQLFEKAMFYLCHWDKKLGMYNNTPLKNTDASLTEIINTASTMEDSPPQQPPHGFALIGRWVDDGIGVATGDSDPSKNRIVQYFIGCMQETYTCLLYTSPSPRDGLLSRMPSSA